MSRTFECFNCHMFFSGPFCPRCSYNSSVPFARHTRRFAPYQAGFGRKADGEVRVIKAPESESGAGGGESNP